MSNQVFHFSNTGISSGQRFYLKDDVSGIFVRNLKIDSNFPVVASNLVYNTGNQTISGIKTFASRPTVNGTGILLSGEAAVLPNTIVYITGNQIISGVKTFASRPTVNGTGVLLSGEAAVLPNTIVYTTGNQTISGFKTFRNTLSVSSISGISGSTLININAINNAQEIFGGNYLGGGINLTAGSGNFIGGSINLSAGPNVGIPYHGNIGAFGNVSINNDNRSIKSVIIYKTGAAATELNVWVQQSSVNVNNAFSISGVEVTPAIYVNRVNNQNISGIKNFISRPTVNGTGVLLSGEAGPSLITIQDEGSSQGSASTLNFVGAGVSASVAGSTATITINTGAGISFISPPATPNTVGTSGQIALDQNYAYFCISNNNWRRSAISSW